LIKSGHPNLATLVDYDINDLLLIEGLTREEIEYISTFVKNVYEEIKNSIRIRIDIENPDQDLELLNSLKIHSQYRADLLGLQGEIKAKLNELDEFLSSTNDYRNFITFLLNKPNDARVNLSLKIISSRINSDEYSTLISKITIAKENQKKLQSVTPLDDFRVNAASYYSLIEKRTGRGSFDDSSYFDKTLAVKINNREFDESLLNVQLRKYQIFGIKFALSQERSIIGDEMGLGKTIQALGFLAQREKEGGKHFFVICPRAVLINWEREIISKSKLRSFRIHGSRQRESLNAWLENGGVAITTFDTIKNFSLDEISKKGVLLDSVVVDEAHHIKNKFAGRSKAVFSWIQESKNVLFLTGTVLENHTSEFISLASYLNSDYMGKLDNSSLFLGPSKFRAEVAPIYLRRNLQEVLGELPDLILNYQYCSFEGADLSLYKLYHAVRNLMGMRRAAFVKNEEESLPDKLVKLKELLLESLAQGRKVIVYSYFKDVLEEVSKLLPEKTLPVVTGNTSVSQRQGIIDKFTASQEPLILVGQITALGTGLNIQAASVVVLCEPQLKPSTEVQAIARAHRMGQVNKVLVYRLHIPTEIEPDYPLDDYLVKRLEYKTEIFNQYARRSELSEQSAVFADAKITLDDFFETYQPDGFDLGKYRDLNLYSILGLDVSATAKDIKKAYHKMVKLYHPDLNPSEGDDRIKLINLAYEILSQESQRKAYDNYFFSRSRV
jgi:SNF2 family DNA or RNA helicase